MEITEQQAIEVVSRMLGNKFYILSKPLFDKEKIVDYEVYIYELKDNIYERISKKPFSDYILD